jgi:hypothetical protein
MLQRACLVFSDSFLGQHQSEVVPPAGRRSSTVTVCGILLGMAWCAFLHGFCFGVLQVEGPQAARDPGLLAGFGMAAAIFLGLPAGMILGLVLNLLRPRPDR